MLIVEGLKEWVELNSIGCRLAMAEIYDGAKFEPAATPVNYPPTGKPHQPLNLTNKRG